MEVRIGDVLIERGVLSAEQVSAVLAHQEKTGEPFGVICEGLLGIEPREIENAWAVQYSRLTRTVDPMNEMIDQRVLATVTRRQAWQFRVLPLRFDGEELMLATTVRHLPRALRFVTNVIGMPCYLVLSEAEALGSALCRYYSLPGLEARSVDDDGLEKMLTPSGWASPQRPRVA